MREKLDSDHRRWFTCAHTILHLCVARDNMQLWVARRNMWRGLKSVAVGTCVCVCVCVCALRAQCAGVLPVYRSHSSC